MKGQNNIWKENAFLTCSRRFLRSNKLEQLLRIQIGKKYWDLEKLEKKKGPTL